MTRHAHSAGLDGRMSVPTLPMVALLALCVSSTAGSTADAQMAESSRRKARACRNLTLEFGEDDDHKEDVTERLRDEQRRSADLENEINEMLATNLSSKIRKWNFDFVTETPLEGDWDWYVEDESRNRNLRENQPGDDSVDGEDVKIR